MKQVAVDVLGMQLPISNLGNKYFLFPIDYFTKWPQHYTSPNKEAVTVTESDD